ncbi:hypothetical protein B5F40_09200 [Gordonibacter sp. An230]|uniref:RNA-binding domain-containing protein n=1 Tax=Gordonibacter sp. An230 TaxID=1965592 RepID=UPI000B366F04|nr:RNA-binding domain-containing protein [Gordonibacter sp. An230]OUO89845.1 hypothetical protein B5F40_09200 [Gordonibacter sp. An230]
MEKLEALVHDLTAYPTEEDWFEFKANWHEPTVIGEYISSLSNAAAFKGRKEGYLIWGVDDVSHEIVGTDFNFHGNVKGEPLEHWLVRQLAPDIAFRFGETEITGKRVVVLAIPAAKTVPTSFAGERYLRIGSSKVKLAKYPEREAHLFWILRDGLPTAENIPASNQELSFEQLFTFYAGRGISLKRETFERNLGLLLDDGRYNLLAQLLSDNSGIAMRVSRFAGANKAARLISIREFGYECLLVSLGKILDYGDVLNDVQVDERDRKLFRKDVRLFSEEAFREGIINAFVHNSWVGENAPMITVYDNRIEILSHGTLAPEQTIEGFFAGQSIPVNKRLSDIFLQMHISERSGRGVPAITDVYGRGAYEFRENAIVLTIPFEFAEGLTITAGDGSMVVPKFDEEFRNSSEVVVFPDSANSDSADFQNRRKGSAERIGGKVAQNKSAITSYLSAAGPSSPRAISNAVGLGMSRTRALLGELVREGILVANGSTRDRTYRIVKEVPDGE